MSAREFRLTPCLDRHDHAEAIRLVNRYLAPRAEMQGGVMYTGSRFDRWDGGGDREGVADMFTDADISALSLLSVTVDARAAIELLDLRRGELSALLSPDPPGCRSSHGR